MSVDPRSAPAAHARTGRRRPTETRTARRAVTVGTAVVALLGVAGVAALLTGEADGASGDDPGGRSDRLGAVAGQVTGCLPATRALQVAAAPDIAAVVREIVASADDQESVDTCAISVTAVEPADVAGSLASHGAASDVWIPDSSTWVADTAALVPAVSVASSPVVFAVPAPAADRMSQSLSPAALLGVDDILASRLADEPIRVGLLDPRRSAASVGALLDVRAAVAGRDDARAALTWALRSSPSDLPTVPAQLLARVGENPADPTGASARLGSDLAVPVSEQAVWAYNTGGDGGDGGDVRAVYAGSDGFELDYPYVVLTAAEDRAAAADRLLALLLSSGARELLQDRGFRSPDGTAGDALTAATGVDPTDRGPGEPATRAVVDDAIRTLELSNQPSRLLTLLDVSASMEAIVPDSGGASRLNLAEAAASRGLGLYPDDSEIGLWTFSTHLTPTSDHYEVVPVGPLAADADGSSGAQRLGEALASVHSKPYGGTGLYDTTLEAVRHLQADWDPTRVNLVILLSDGQNDDDGISLDELLTALTTELDPERPVGVIAIAFGPDSDVSAMSQISAATHGATYVAEDPRDVGEIFLDAVGQRLCRPEC